MTRKTPLFLPAHTRPVDSSADGAQQTTVPIRSGQRQGFLVSVTNPGPWTQTILGPGGGFVTPGDLHGGNVAVSLADPFRPPVVYPPRAWALPVAIPPHQSRMVRVEWVSTACIGDHGELGIDTLRLRVRIGWITRTEAIPLGMDVALSGPSRGPCH